ARLGPALAARRERQEGFNRVIGTQSTISTGARHCKEKGKKGFYPARRPPEADLVQGWLGERPGGSRWSGRGLLRDLGRGRLTDAPQHVAICASETAFLAKHDRPGAGRRNTARGATLPGAGAGRPALLSKPRKRDEQNEPSPKEDGNAAEDQPDR